MKSSSITRPGAVAFVCALACALIPATASARSVGAQLRVEATDGTILADVTQYTSPAKVRTDPNAKCFQGGVGGSGKVVSIPNPTALGLVADALPNVKALRPLSLTDEFSFGLGVCGIGGLEAKGQGFWYLKRNHVGSQVGGDQLKVHGGDRILWYLAPGFPPGDELALKLPARAKPGTPVTATVLAYADGGKRAPVKGAKLPFAHGPTDAGGHATLEFPKAGTQDVQARLAGDIPSNAITVCVNDDLSKCPAHEGRRIFGSPRKDRIATTAGSDHIAAGGGNDTVRLRRGGADGVNCGPGTDVVIQRRGDSDDRIGRSCEKVIRK
jgi:hemolysin type calcium-binding protein